ncbi:MAG: M20/M25/M40 family metallo-hydrolase [Acidobacteria bacterium]|nr:M20/M25/M40 family metallo-hydrolase [Acidobacteriota bacterium]MXX85749.1 M20/M25/M40 family metallo-hydrolase [Acidobacteriota bacterium]MYE44191.1 M20/M25/M40 family metallo-hydrolase [Acidobacteriota bacterium]MYG76253.1 M20/M25/M40 family metallo-hydrolase [Acidobacteriota bacterium]
MAAITADPRVVAALDDVLAMDEENERLLIELTEIEAPPFKEEKRALHYRGLIREAGLDADLDEIGNVVARRAGRGGGRTVAVVAHLDTVFPEGTDVTVRREGDKLMAPGIADDARGLVTILTILQVMDRHGLDTRDDVLFVGSVGEEGIGDLRGVKHLFRDGGPSIDAFIAIDGTTNTRVLNHAIGSHRYRVRFLGPGGHSWGAFGLGNPAHAMARAIKLFDDRAGEYVTAGARTTYSIGRIGGGTSVNSIPFESWMEVDMRSMEPGRLKEIDAIFQAAMTEALAEQNELRRDGEEITVDIEMIGNRPSGIVPIDTPLIQRAFAATRAVGAEPELSMGSTDSNVAISLGIPATTIGSGGEGFGAHSLHEWWANRDGHLGIQKALLLVLAEAGFEAAN